MDNNTNNQVPQPPVDPGSNNGMSDRQDIPKSGDPDNPPGNSASGFHTPQSSQTPQPADRIFTPNASSSLAGPAQQPPQASQLNQAVPNIGTSGQQPINGANHQATPGAMQSNTMAASVAAQLQANLPPEPKKSRARLIITIIASALLLLGIGEAVFYFAYWTRSDVVYTRFQNQAASIISKSLNSEVKLLNNIQFSAELASEGGNLPLSGKGSGRLVDSGSDTNADITYQNASINLAVITVNNSSSTYDLFFKYKGIEKFYNTLASNPATKEQVIAYKPFVDLLKKYDDRWISLDLSSLDAIYTQPTNETLTQEDYKSLLEKLLPIFNQRFLGLDKKNAVLKTSNIRSDKVAGQSAWAYDISVDNTKYNEMIDELIKGVDTTKLSVAKKKIAKDLLLSQKNTDTSNSSIEGNSSQDDLGLTSTYRSVSTYTIWLDKTTALPLKYRDKTEQTIDNKPYTSDELVAEFTSISADKIQAVISGTSSAFDATCATASSNQTTCVSTVKSTIAIDNKTSKIDVNIAYDSDTKSDKDLAVTVKFQLQPTSDTKPVTKPASSITYQQLLEGAQNLNQ